MKSLTNLLNKLLGLELEEDATIQELTDAVELRATDTNSDANSTDAPVVVVEEIVAIQEQEALDVTEIMSAIDLIGVALGTITGQIATLQSGLDELKQVQGVQADKIVVLAKGAVGKVGTISTRVMQAAQAAANVVGDIGIDGGQARKEVIEIKGTGLFGPKK